MYSKLEINWDEKSMHITNVGDCKETGMVLWDIRRINWLHLPSIMAQSGTDSCLN